MRKFIFHIKTSCSADICWISFMKIQCFHSLQVLLPLAILWICFSGTYFETSEMTMVELFARIVNHFLAVICICEKFHLECDISCDRCSTGVLNRCRFSKFRNVVGSIPVEGNSPVIGGWVLWPPIIQHKGRSMTNYWGLTGDLTMNWDFNLG